MAGRLIKRGVNPSPLVVCVTGVIALLLVPVFVLIVFSFNADRFPSLPWRGTTLSWYQSALSNSDLVASIVTSLKLTALVTATCLVLGSAAAWGILRMRTSLALLFGAIISLPFLVPAVLLGLALRMASLYFPAISPEVRLVVAHTLVFSPLVFALVYAHLGPTARQLELVAQDLGCSPVQAIWWVHLPLTGRVLAGAGLLVFVLAWDEFILSWMLLNLDVTLPVRIWGMMEASISPEINAVGTLVLASTVSVLFIAMRLLTRNDT